MFATEVAVNNKVWIRIGQGANAPLVPGVVTNAQVQDRQLMRSAAKGGPLTVLNSVIAISLRENVTPSNGRPLVFYTERPEALIAISARDIAIPAIDGTDEMSVSDVLTVLRAKVHESLATLTPAPNKDRAEAAAAEFMALPALA